ncbi:hypothetical protein NQ315_010783 [Exocentrus adspersus]|uniref:Caspase Dronc n=1 Tax=Exocentrus adspersus TaxID=1586481 RepID=A0AAV8VVE4_9CUCU|nr:hypothetical protein NQ315_010783 [Exocentrus adspersus]
MLEESKELIIKNFVTLMKECNVDVLKELLVKRGIFTPSEMNNIFLSEDARHNKRLFFFNIQKKNQHAFHALVETLRETNQYNIAKLLVPEVIGCHPYVQPPERDTNDINMSRLSESLPIINVNSNAEYLTVKVVPSTQFHDTVEHNRYVDFYSTRSKNRGRVLIINNYKFENDRRHPYRSGAEVDSENLRELFRQLGGWEVHHHENLTSEEMNSVLVRFAQDRENKQYDICFVIVMSHGGELHGDTIVFGIDDLQDSGHYIFTNDIQKHFTNEKCRGFRGRPKVFLFQVCRGETLDHTILHTEVDSKQHVSPLAKSPEPIITNIRTQEDILTGFATLLGYKAHRHPSTGSWYIELICKNFMNYSHEISVNQLLQLVDQDLKRRMSEYLTMQTAEHRYKGFKTLYLNPGIYSENGVLKYFNSSGIESIRD